MLVNVQLPDAASVQRTQKVMARIEEIARNCAGRRATPSRISGQSLLLNANASNLGSMYVMLEEFHSAGAGLTANAIAAACTRRPRSRFRRPW